MKLLYPILGSLVVLLPHAARLGQICQLSHSPLAHSFTEVTITQTAQQICYDSDGRIIDCPQFKTEQHPEPQIS